MKPCPGLGGWRTAKPHPVAHLCPVAEAAANDFATAIKFLKILALTLPLLLMGSKLPAQQYPQTGPAYGQYPETQPQEAGSPDPVDVQQEPQPNSHPGYPQQGGGQMQALNADQLEQLVAPIALYPDNLVAIVLAASTYPMQVTQADRWRQAQGNASQDQIAAEADVQSWDPSVKALTAFPQVLAQMDQNLQWKTDRGNAYFTQPQDVMEAVQVMRQRAQAAGNLQNTPQETVRNYQGNIALYPTNPQVVYVPSYNPWTIYGQPVTPYPGFSLLGALGSFFGSTFGSSPMSWGLGIAMSAFSNSPWGWLTWGLNWLTQSVLFHQSNYCSRSNTVADWHLPPGSGMRAYGRQRNGMYSAQNGYGYGRGGYNGGPRSGYASGFMRQPERSGYRQPTNYARSYQTPQPGYARPPQLAYSHNQPTMNRSQAYGRPSNGYGSSFYGRQTENYAGRPAPMQTYRAPATTFAHNDFSQRSFGSFGGNSFKPEHSGGFHLFGGGHSSGNFYGGGHAPNSFGGHSGGGFHMFGGHSGGGGGHFGGGGHSGGHGGGGHHH